MTAGSMRDALAHPAWHVRTTRFARALASHLDLRPVELPWPGFGLDAALAVAPAALRSYRAPTTPVVVLNGRSATTQPPGGSSVICGVHDDDAACAAIAGALADALGLQLILVHAVRSFAPASHAFAALSGMTFPLRAGDGEDPAAGREIVNRAATAAGLGQPGPAEFRVMHGAPGPAIVATARRERAAFVVVSASRRARLQQALRGSTTGYLIRRCPRPVVVCPRDPAAALRLREALTPIPVRGPTHRWR
jgi:nucleotide-binding universal stress UspA family protein